MAINARQAVAKSGKKATIKNPALGVPGVNSVVLTHPVKPVKPNKSKKLKSHSYASKAVHQKQNRHGKSGPTMTLY